MNLALWVAALVAAGQLGASVPVPARVARLAAAGGIGTAATGGGGKAEARAPAAEPDPCAPDAGQPGRIAINTATIEELQKLPGIGPKKAAAIAQERARRPFRKAGDLRRIKGFGEKTVRRLAPLLSFEGP
jgi:competence protein ComEA